MQEVPLGPWRPGGPCGPVGPGGPRAPWRPAKTSHSILAASTTARKQRFTIVYHQKFLIETKSHERMSRKNTKE